MTQEMKNFIQGGLVIMTTFKSGETVIQTGTYMEVEHGGGTVKNAQRIEVK